MQLQGDHCVSLSEALMARETQQQQQYHKGLEVAVRGAVETLDIDLGLSFLHLCPYNIHAVFCEKAALYSKLADYWWAFKHCKRAFDFTLNCSKCIQTFIDCLNSLNLADLQTLTNLASSLSPKENPRHSYLLDKINYTERRLHSKFQSYFECLHRSGARFSKIELIESDFNCRKVVARLPIKKGQVVIYIPKSQLITLETTKTSPVVQKLYHRKSKLFSPKHTLLSIYLLEQLEKGQDSQHYEYLKLLPDSFGTFPFNYCQPQLELLQGSSFLEKLQAKKIAMVKDYELVVEICPGFGRFSLEKFCNARMAVSSRVFGIVTNKIKTDALVPVADMLNHHNAQQASWCYCDHQEGFIIRSQRKIDPGMEIYDFYGHKCNSRFLMSYGFVLRHNAENQVQIQLPLKKLNQPKYTLKVSKQLKSRNFQVFISAFRYIANHPNEQELQQEDEELHETIMSTPFMSLENETAAWLLIHQTLSYVLLQYPTSHKVDIRVLAEKKTALTNLTYMVGAPEATFEPKRNHSLRKTNVQGQSRAAEEQLINEMNCIILRAGEKQVIHFYLKMSNRVVRYLQNPQKSQKNRNLTEYEPYLITLQST